MDFLGNGESGILQHSDRGLVRQVNIMAEVASRAITIPLRLII